jgi:hypothetical protein
MRRLRTWSTWAVPLGGFVPMLRAKGYDAVGIDPQAPEQPHYQRIEFERDELPPHDAVVASTSLHHVADPAAAPDGEVVPAAEISRMTAINLQDEFAEVVTTAAACTLLDEA